MVRMFAFDLYGTLLSIRTYEQEPKAWKSLAAFMGYHGAGYEAEELRESYDSFVDEEKRIGKERTGHEDFEIDVRRVFTKLYEKKDVKCDENMITVTAQVYRAGTTVNRCCLYDGVKEMLLSLKSAGFPLALLSNAQQAYTEPELHEVGVTGYFDRIFLSSEYGVKKPSPDFYHYLIDWASTLGIRPEEIMMTGNSPRDDIIPARRLGLKTCFIHSDLTEADAKIPEADIVLQEMDMRKLCQEFQNLFHNF